MTEIYACLCGQWVNLTEDMDCKIGENKLSPSQWWEENAPIYSPKVKNEFNTYYQQDYVHIYYKGVDYRIHPIFIQVVQR